MRVTGVLVFVYLCSVEGGGDIKSIRFCNSSAESPVTVSVPRTVLLGKDDDESPEILLRVEGELSCELEGDRKDWIPRYSNGTTGYESKSHFVSRNGSLMYKREVYSTAEFCVDEITEELVSLGFCVQRDEFKETSPAIRKCCPGGEIYDLSQYERGNVTCVPHEVTLEPPVYGSDGGIVQFIPNRKGWCRGDDQRKLLFSGRELLAESPILLHALVNGSLLYKEKHEDWKSREPGTFCMEYAKNFPNLETEAADDGTDLVVFFCTLTRESWNEGTQSSGGFAPQLWVTVLYGLSIGIACIFLIVTVLVHLALWDKQNLHSWTILCSVMSMTGWYSALLVTYFYTFHTEKGKEADGVCTGIAVTTHFFLLLTFSWITLISFDIWSTFRHLKMVNRKAFQWKRFVGYSIFAFAVPSIVVTVGLILDHFYKNDLESGVVTPEYGGLKCFVNIEHATLEYVYSPVAILLIINVLFFGTTIRTIYKLRKSTRVATSTTRVSNSDKNSFVLFTKLFFVMGVVWTLELGAYFLYLSDPFHPMVIIMDMVHNVQPVAIFVIFVCKKEVVRGLEQKYTWLKRLRQVCWRQGSTNGGSVQTDDTHVSNASRSMSISSLRFQSWKKPQEVVTSKQPSDVQV